MPTKRIIITVLCCLSFAVQGEEAKNPGKEFFRWTDKEGKVHYGDHLPPEQSLIGGIKYDARGLNKQIIEGAKTPEQLEAESTLKSLRAEQQRLLNEQSDRDQALLRSFRSEEEVHMALQGNLNTLNSQIKVIQANLQRQQEKLAPIQQQVDDLQKASKPVPKPVSDNLSAVQRQVSGYQEQIAKSETEKRLYTERAERDIARLKMLKTPVDSGRPISESAKGSALELMLGAARCANLETCNKNWDAARRYLQTFTTEPLTIDTDRILRTGEPTSEEGFALMVVRTTGQTGEILFLDVRCSRSSIGQTLCAGDKAHEVRLKFRKALALQ